MSLDRTKRFADLVADYLALHGSKPIIISRAEHPVEWEQWRAYYRYRKFVHSLDLMQERSTKTVPCLSPLDLDREYAQSRLPLNERRYAD
jgi:hypothetical protein